MSINTKTCPYVDIGRNGFTYVYVVGRAGTIVWRGNQTVKEKEFLKAVGDALAVKATPPIEKALAPALGKALAKYHLNRFSESRTAARKVLDKHRSKSTAASEEIARDAALLIERIDAFSAELLKRSEEALESQSALIFVETAETLSAGYAKSDAARTVRDLEKRALKDRRFAAKIKVARQWLGLLEKRPLLFPARDDKASRAFARKLEKFVKQNGGSVPAGEAEKLLARFDDA